MTAITLPAIVRRKAAKHHFNLWLMFRQSGGALTVYNHPLPAPHLRPAGCRHIRPADAARIARMCRWTGLTRAQRDARRLS